jgi:hypothetical protein
MSQDIECNFALVRERVYSGFSIRTFTRESLIALAVIK